MTDASAELVEHVDEDGNVIGVVTRGQIRAEGLRHRCSYTFVLRSNGCLVVHRRADWKEVLPGYWDLAFGGFCGVGESWSSSAERELREEAGLTIDDLDGRALVELGATRYSDAYGSLVGRAYLARTDVGITCVDGEVAETAEVSLGDLDTWLRDGRQVCGDTPLEPYALLRSHLNL